MIETDRLIIRPAQMGDEVSLYNVYGDAKTMQYWSTLPDVDVSTTRLRVEELVNLQAPITYFVIEYLGRAVGTIGIHERDELGFILDRTLWRKGLMREALEQLIPWLFETLQISQITADVDPRNTASIGILTAIGFTVTGEAKNTICIADNWCDSVYLALQRPS